MTPDLMTPVKLVIQDPRINDKKIQEGGGCEGNDVLLIPNAPPKPHYLDTIGF